MADRTQILPTALPTESEGALLNTLLRVVAPLLVLAVSAGMYYRRVWEILHYDALTLNDFKGIFAALTLIAERRNPYDYDLTMTLVSCTNCPYQLPPLLAAVLSPLAALTPVQIQLVWVLVIQAALLAMVVFAIKLVRPRMGAGPSFLAAALVYGFYPLYTDLQLGNVSVLLGFLVTMTAWFWQQNRRTLAGLCLGAGMVIKFVPGMMLAYFLWKREYRLVVISLSFAAALLLLPDLLMGTQYLQTYIATFSQVLERWTFGPLSHIDNQSLHGAFSRFYVLAAGSEDIPSSVRIFSLALTGLLAAAILMALPRDSKPTEPATILQYALFLFLFPLGSSNAWSHYYAWTVMLFPVIVHHLVELWRPGKWSYGLALSAGAGFVLASQPYRLPRLLGINTQAPTLTLSPLGVTLQSVLVYGALILVGVALCILYSRSPRYAYTTVAEPNCSK